ncbi:hypothetical protein Y032_0010g1043 [Ancylostoma ceylanicum]|uniref:Uncharacterized protein n=1 Tax=Ancylostoma ceylanicum TaxID=53326 RepID=A0A016VF40_9BILA|nr:hypothetical protein Y032_0010g1043 [Ancylostoma ceylanicum]
MSSSLASIGSYIILVIQLPVMASLSVFCRRKQNNDGKDGVVLTKDAPKEGSRSKSRQWGHQPRPPPNVPIAPPPKDPLDDTLRGVKSLMLERSGKGGGRGRGSK